MAAATIDEYLDGVGPLVAPVAQMLRTLIESELPDTPSRMYQGIPVWSFGEKPSVGLKANAKDVALLLFLGQRVVDPVGRLTASGSFELATAKLATPDDVDETVIRDWLRQARSLEA